MSERSKISSVSEGVSDRVLSRSPSSFFIFLFFFWFVVAFGLSISTDLLSVLDRLQKRHTAVDSMVPIRMRLSPLPPTPTFWRKKKNCLLQCQNCALQLGAVDRVSTYIACPCTASAPSHLFFRARATRVAFASTKSRAPIDLQCLCALPPCNLVSDFFVFIFFRLIFCFTFALFAPFGPRNGRRGANVQCSLLTSLLKQRQQQQFVKKVVGIQALVVLNPRSDVVAIGGDREVLRAPGHAGRSDDGNAI